MHKNLEAYLEEIGHFLAGSREREEILAEIRSHILEKAEREAGPVTESSLQEAIASYGGPRQVAEKYLDGRPIIAPAYQRHLFRYTSLLFAIHAAFALLAVVLRESFVVFPFLFVPRLGIAEAFMYLPMAFLADFGIVALVLHFVTRSGREIRLPWPRFARDIDEVGLEGVKTLAGRVAILAGAGIMTALAAAAVWLYRTYGSVFLLRTGPGDFRHLLLPGPDRWLSLIAIALLAVGALHLVVKSFCRTRRRSRQVDVVSDGIALLLVAAALNLQRAGIFTSQVPARLHGWLHNSVTTTLLVVAAAIAFDLILALVRLGRRNPAA